MNLSRQAKRLVVIIAVSIIIILLSKFLLSKAAKNLGLAAEKKLQAKAAKLAPVSPASAPAIDLTTASAPPDTMETAVQSAPVTVDGTTATQ